MANTESTQPTDETVLNQVRGVVDHHGIDEGAALLEDMRTRATSQNNDFSEAIILDNLGEIYEKQAKYLEAQAAYERSISILMRVRGEKSPYLVQPMANLSSLLYESRQFTRAENLLLGAIAILDRIGQPGKPTAAALNRLGKVYLGEQRYALAEQTAKKSLMLFASGGEPEGLGAAVGYSILGAVLTQYGEVSAAEQTLGRALAILRRVLNPDDRRIGEGIANLALLYLTEGSVEKAEPLLESAYECLEASGVNSSFRRAILFRYAGIERQLGHKRKAKELTEQAQLLTARSPESSVSRYIVDARGYRR